MSSYQRMLSLLLALGLASVVHAGNKDMIEKRVEELDELNKEAVGQISGLPKSGQIELKANVKIENGERKIEVVEKTISVKEEAIELVPKKTETEKND